MWSRHSLIWDSQAMDGSLWDHVVLVCPKGVFKQFQALAGVAQWMEHQTANQINSGLRKTPIYWEGALPQLHREQSSALRTLPNLT